MNDTKELPEGWEVYSVSAISETIQYGITDSSSSNKVGPKLLRITDIQNNRVIWDDVPYCKTITSGFDKYLLSPGDILFARTGATVGKSFLVSGDVPEAVFASYLIRIKLKPDFSAKYLYYFFQSPEYWSQIKSEQAGIGQPNVNGTKLGKIVVPLPKVSIQKSIVSKIEELFSELDKVQEQLETALQQLKVYRQAVLKWAFEGRLTNKNVKEGKLPEGWVVSDFGNFIEGIESGKSYSCDERPPNDGEVGIVKVSAVSWGEFNDGESKTIYNNDHFKEKYLIRESDFLFSRANTLELIGACVIVGKVSKKVMLSDKILRIIFKGGLEKNYALYYLNSFLGKKQIQSLSTGNQESMRNISQGSLRAIVFPIPFIEEQRAIVARLDSILDNTRRLEQGIKDNLLKIKSLRQSILKQAFEGKLI